MKRIISLVAASLLVVSAVAPVKARDSKQSAIEAAKEVKAEIEQLEEETLRIQTNLDRELASWGPGDLQAESQTIKHFKSLIPNLRLRGQKILDRDGEFNQTFDRYLASLRKAPAAFNAAAELYRKYASDEEDSFFKSEYMELANQAEEIGTSYGNRAAKLKGLHETIIEKRVFVERSLVFLDRLERFLEIYPDHEAGQKIQDYLARLNKYVEDFERAIRSFKEFSNKVRDYGGGDADNEPDDSSGSFTTALQTGVQQRAAAGRDRQIGPQRVYFASQTEQRENPRVLTPQTVGPLIREWVDFRGRSLGRAQVHQIFDDQVMLRTANGDYVSLPIRMLSSGSRQAVNRMRKTLGSRPQH